MHVLPDKRPGVYLKAEQFFLVARVLGHTSDAAVGRALGMTERTIRRAKAGIIGEQFIAAVLRTFGEHQEELAQLNINVAFDDLFEIGDKAASA